MVLEFLGRRDLKDGLVIGLRIVLETEQTAKFPIVSNSILFYLGPNITLSALFTSISNVCFHRASHPHKTISKMTVLYRPILIFSSFEKYTA